MGLYVRNASGSREEREGNAMSKETLILSTGLFLVSAATSPAADQTPSESAPPPSTQLKNVKNADPSVILVGSTYYSVESDGSSIYVREAPSPSALNSAGRTKVWGSKPNVWAPEIIKAANTFYVYFAAGNLIDQRMYYVSSTDPTTGYSSALPLNLPDNKWAIDGIAFQFNNEWWFVWSGWAGNANVEQNLYIARMSDPATVTGGRFIISQPRERWERSVGNPYINEGPQPIKDPSGQLHIVYSGNGSWSTDYCLGDLRLAAGGDPTNARAWYKSNGCLFGAKKGLMAKGFEPVMNAKGVGHHSFLLPSGDINASPASGATSPFMYHGVPNSLQMNWSNRYWYTGTFTWTENETYCRSRSDCTTGWGLRFSE
jgi:GH43 family beta-xylosidase